MQASFLPSTKHYDPKHRDRNWCATGQNIDYPPTPDLFESKNLHPTYIVYQRERCPTTGKEHYQCYIEFQNACMLCTLMKKFPFFYWTPRETTRKACIIYCTKQDTRIDGPFYWPVEQPTEPDRPAPSSICSPTGANQTPTDANGAPIPKTGKESTADDAAMMLLNPSVSLKRAAQTYPGQFLKHPNGFSRLRAIVQPRQKTKPTVIVYYGPTGCGKSKLAWERSRQEFDEEDIYPYHATAENGKEWWDGYDGQPCVIIDEFRGRKFHYDRILSLLDRNPVMVPFKGGHSNFVPQKIYITSFESPRAWYPKHAESDIAQLLRRIDRCYVFCAVSVNGRPVIRNGELQYVRGLDPENMKAEQTPEAITRHYQNLLSDGYVLHVHADETGNSLELYDESVADNESDYEAEHCCHDDDVIE